MKIKILFLTTVLVLLLAGWTTTISSKKNNENGTLKQAFKDFFYLGTALNVNQIWDKDQKAIPLIANEFNSIVAENCMKSMYLQPQENVFYFKDADAFVTYGEKHNMFIIGHTLIWHSQTPDWFFTDKKGADVSREVLIERMKNHITTVVSRYKGRINGWDVVNEAIEDDGSFRKSKFLQIIGEDYLQLAFEFARKADPKAELYYNDYSMSNPNKRKAVVALIKNLQDKGIRIDGIGMQGHIGLKYPSLESFEQSIIAFAQTRAKVMITEFDVNVLPNPSKDVGADIALTFDFQKKLDPYTAGLPNDKIKEFNERYIDFFKLFLKHHHKISRVTLWGISDKDSWLNNWPVKGRTNYPLLFDREYKAKEVVKSIMSLTTDPQYRKIKNNY